MEKKLTRSGSLAIGVLLLSVVCGVSSALAEEDCGTRWSATEASGDAMYHGFSMSVHTIVVDVGRWNTKTYAEKQALIEMFHCTFPPAGAVTFPIEIRSNMTNNLTGRWTEEGGLVVSER